jgi:hypothetical protein
MVRIEECRKCKKPFTITGAWGGPMQDNEDIKCPHCQMLWGTEKTAGVFSTYKLTAEQQREHARSKRL